MYFGPEQDIRAPSKNVSAIIRKHHVKIQQQQRQLKVEAGCCGERSTELMQRVWKDKCLRRGKVPSSAEYTKRVIRWSVIN